MEKDMTAGTPGKIIFNFTMPIFIGNIFQQFYNMADTVIVGKFVGNAALAAVGACGTLVFLIIGFLQGVTAGFTVVTAQHFGAGNMKAMKKSVASGAVLTGIVTVILTLLSMISMAKVLHLMNTPSDMYGEAYGYIMVICGGIVAQALYNYLASVLRALGDSKRPLYFLVIAALLNIVLDLVFVLVFSWGVFGVALATILAQICSWVFGIFYINRKYPFLHIRLFRMRLDRRLLGQVIRLGIPSAIQECQFAVGILIMQALINGFGNDFAAGFTAANKIDTFAFMPIESFSIAATTYVGQNMGAGRLDRVQTGTRRALVLGTLVCLAMSAVVLPLRRPLLMLFNREPGVVAAGEAYLLRALSLMFILAMMFIMNGVLRGAGATTVPMVASIISLWAARIPVAYALAYFFGPEEIYWAYPIGWALGLLICVVSYCRGRWKDKCIVGQAPQE